MRRALLLALLFPLVPVLVAPSPAFACSCVIATPREHLQHADVVVAGELVSVQETPPDSDGIVSSGDPTTYTVSVSATYKGEPATELSFTSARDGASCGVQLVNGREYVYFLSGDRGDYTASACGGTGTVRMAKVAALTGGPQQEPSDESVVIDSDEPAQNAYPWLLPGLGAGALVALGIGFVRWRRGARA